MEWFSLDLAINCFNINLLSVLIGVDGSSGEGLKAMVEVLHQEGSQFRELVLHQPWSV